ncbi:hypothetical protein [Pseudoalteromonas sp. R3]|uniref:hypothetical protein n=1 Tax=Pseudoalteromonas sp. R3 TaxID=1709477 RepID=UPI0006B541BC|nr:hypothetical protein [Pseudoalteromonas sp. R3]AZZ96047.1 hypothetical protein ELR70_02260 [Pseudoalteromonas sp. R3]
MEFKKTLLAIGVLSVLSGCGSDNDNAKQTTQDQTPDTTSTSREIKGVAAKGTLINAPVTFFTLKEGKPVQVTEQSAVFTDEKGQFSTTLDGVQGIVKAQISVSQDTQKPTYMICDAPAGCGQNDAGNAIAFGERINLTKEDPELVLSTFVNVTEQSSTANITPLTHFAAAIAQQRGDVSVESIEKAHSEIADLFGLVGALQQMTPTMLEDSASLLGEDNSNDLRYALINAGIAHALFADSNEQTNALSTRLAEAIADIQATDGAFLANREGDDDASFEFNLSDILAGAELASKQLITLIKADPTLADQLGKLSKLEKLSTRLHNEMLSADMESEDRVKGQAQQQSGKDAVAKAAAMVQDIRVFANLFDIADAQGKDVQTQGEQFVTLIEDATDVVREQANSYKLLADVSEALALIDSARRAGDLPNNNLPIKLDDYLELAGATGVAVIDEAGLSYSVSASAGDEQLQANANIMIAEDNKTYTLTVSGKVENSIAALTLHPGSQVQVVLNQPVTVAQLKEDNTPTLDGRHGSLTLNVTVAQKATDAVANPVSFKGMINAELTAKHIEKIEQTSSSSGAISTYDFSIRPDTVFVPAMLSLRGAFIAAQGDQISANLTVKLDNLSEFNPAGFEQFGRVIPKAGTLTFASQSKAKITSTAGDTVDIDYQPVNEQGIATLTTQYAQDDGTLATHIRELSTYEGTDYMVYKRTYSDGYSPTRLERVLPDGHGKFDAQFVSFRRGKIVSYANGQVVLESGETIPADDLPWSTWIYADNAETLKKLRRMPVNFAAIKDVQTLLTPAHMDNIHLAQLEGGYARYQLTEQDYQVGGSYTLSARYLYPKFSNQPEITVAADGNTVTSVIGELTQSWTSSSDDAKAANYHYSVSHNGTAIEQKSAFINVVEPVNEQNAYMISTRYFDQFHNIDRSITAFLKPSSAGGYAAYYIEPYGLNEQGLPVDANGKYIDPEQNPAWTASFDTYEQAVWDITGTELAISRQGIARVEFERNLRQYQTLRYPGHGQISVYYFGRFSSYDAFVIIGKPDNTYQIENETNYLDVSAAMNVNVTLGEYHVDLSLLGQRTDFKAGELELDVDYQLPGSELKRSFTVYYNTETQQLSANNAEGVSLVMAEADTDTQGEQTLGTIMVGEEQAARIVKRDSGVFIIYSNEQIETL